MSIHFEIFWIVWLDLLLFLAQMTTFQGHLQGKMQQVPVVLQNAILTYTFVASSSQVEGGGNFWWTSLASYLNISFHQRPLSSHIKKSFSFLRLSQKVKNGLVAVWKTSISQIYPIPITVFSIYIPPTIILTPPRRCHSFFPSLTLTWYAEISMPIVSPGGVISNTSFRTNARGNILDLLLTSHDGSQQ